MASMGDAMAKDLWNLKFEFFIRVCTNFTEQNRYDLDLRLIPNFSFADSDNPMCRVNLNGDLEERKKS
jgi:hypothetical protein